MLTLSPSQLAKFRTCPRSYHHYYVLGRQPVAGDYKLAFGTLWDDVTGVWWEHGPAAAVAWLVERADKIDAVDAAKVAALLAGYNPPRERFEFLGNQVVGLIKVKNPTTGYPMHDVTLKCVADTLLKDKATGQLVVREAKTTSRDIEGFGPYWQRLQVDGQVGAYFHAFGAETLYYDVVGRPGIKCCGTDEKAAEKTGRTAVDCYQERLENLIAENPGHFYQWREIVKTDADLTSAMADIHQSALMVRQCKRAGWFPRNSGSCVGMFGTCPYLDVCSGRASIEDDGLFTQVERVRQLDLAS